MFRDYYELTKPGIIYGNAVTALGGFLLASHWHPDLARGAEMLIGLALIIASGCVFNNYIDRDIDAKMERTKNRALPRGRVSGRAALVFGAILGLVGSIALLQTNPLATAIAVGGLFFYIFPYSLWTKRYSSHATTVGAIAGAVPPVVGYTAVTNSIDAAAILLFIILVAWQIPHALGIAFRRADEYAAASIPVFPLKEGALPTKAMMTSYVVIFSAATLALYGLGYVGRVYAAGMTILDAAWLFLVLSGFSVRNDKAWGKRVFLLSLVIILVFSVLIAADAGHI